MVNKVPNKQPYRGRPKASDEERNMRNRLRKIEMDEARDIINTEIEQRFVEEVEIMEREGRVQSRAKLERDLLMYYNKITQIKYGKSSLQPCHIHLLKKHYNADVQFILFGVRDMEHSGSIQGGRKLNIYKPYTYNYKTWKKGKKDEDDETIDQNVTADSETGG